MDYNLLKKSYCYTDVTTWSGVSGYTNKSLSYDELLLLVDDSTVNYVTVSGGKYIKVSATLGRNFYCKEMRLYTSGSGICPVLFYYQDADEQEVYIDNPTFSNGYYNYTIPSDGVMPVTAIGKVSFVFCASGTQSVYYAQVLKL